MYNIKKVSLLFVLSTIAGSAMHASESAEKELRFNVQYPGSEQATPITTHNTNAVAGTALLQLIRENAPIPLPEEMKVFCNDSVIDPKGLYFISNFSTASFLRVIIKKDKAT